MKMPQRFSVKGRLRSFVFAFQGIEILLKTQHNARIHAFAGLAILGLSVWLQVGKIKFCLILFAVALVWVAEAFNTVFEIVVNMVSPAQMGKARRAKDVAAAAVLFASTAAAVIGLLILGPPLFYAVWPFLGLR